MFLVTLRVSELPRFKKGWHFLLTTSMSHPGLGLCLIILFDLKSTLTLKMSCCCCFYLTFSWNEIQTRLLEQKERSQNFQREKRPNAQVAQTQMIVTFSIVFKSSICWRCNSAKDLLRTTQSWKIFGQSFVWIEPVTAGWDARMLLLC